MWALFPTAFLLTAAVPCLGQELRTVGIHLGQVSSRQLLSGPYSTGTSTGITAGVNVDVPTPLNHFSVRGELAYNQRGGVVWDDELDPEREAGAETRSHYLSVLLQGKAVARWGPGAAYLFAGPTLDQLLETQCSEDLCRLLVEETPTVLGVTAGSGVSLAFWDRFRGDFEIRLTEGLAEVYRFSDSEVRYRSVEILFRGSFPF